MRQLLSHLVGDYIAQSDYMAVTKVDRSWEGVAWAAGHAVLYTTCFVPLTRSPARLALIGITHGLLDHYRPFPKLIALKDTWMSPNIMGDSRAQDVPVWLRIVTDNTVHLLINEIALSWRRKP